MLVLPVRIHRHSLRNSLLEVEKAPTLSCLARANLIASFAVWVSTCLNEGCNVGSWRFWVFVRHTHSHTHTHTLDHRPRNLCQFPCYPPDSTLYWAFMLPLQVYFVPITGGVQHVPPLNRKQRQDENDRKMNYSEPNLAHTHTHTHTHTPNLFYTGLDHVMLECVEVSKL